MKIGRGYATYLWVIIFAVVGGRLLAKNILRDAETSSLQRMIS